MNKTRKSFNLILAGCLLALGVAAASRAPARGNSLPAAAEPEVQRWKPRPRGGGPARTVCDRTRDDTFFAGTKLKGTLVYPAVGVGGETAATLVIDETNPTTREQTFTLTAEDGRTWSGRFSARTTCGYTGAAMRFPDSTISVRACREKAGVAFRSSVAEGFEFVSDESPVVSGAEKWGQCYRKAGLLRGNRPL